LVSNGQEFKNITNLPLLNEWRSACSVRRTLSRKLESRKKRGEKSATEEGSNMAKNVLRVQKFHERLKRMRKTDHAFVVSMLVKAKPA
jgi:putative transposase